jgi:hypothetical protein
MTFISIKESLFLLTNCGVKSPKQHVIKLNFINSITEMSAPELIHERSYINNQRGGKIIIKLNLL